MCLGMFFINICFHIKRLRILAIKMTFLTFFIKILLSKMSQPSQAIFVPIAPCDNVEDNSNNDHESNIEVPGEIFSHSDQNLNEAHETI